MRGFYRERAERKLPDFSFLEDILVVDGDGNICSAFNYNFCFDIALMDFLHGSCHIFSRCLHDRFGYSVHNVLAKNGKLIHSYCVDDNEDYIDVRGKTSDAMAFFSEFEDELDLCRFADYPTHNKIAALENGLDHDMYRAAEYVIRDYFRFYCLSVA